MEQLLSEAARTVVVAAAGEARTAGHASIGIEHLLAGLLRTDRTLSLRALELLELTVEPVRARLVELAGAHAGDGDPPAAGPKIAFDEWSKHALAQALRAARALGRDQIELEHLLLAIDSTNRSRKRSSEVPAQHGRNAPFDMLLKRASIEDYVRRTSPATRRTDHSASRAEGLLRDGRVIVVSAAGDATALPDAEVRRQVACELCEVVSRALLCAHAERRG